MITLAFAADGPPDHHSLGGRSRAGHWSVDSADKLVSDASGRSEGADAWIAGGELMISMRDEAMKFEKAAT